MRVGSNYPELASFMTLLINPETNEVRTGSLVNLHTLLTKNGFRLSWKEPYGPIGGTQLYYFSTIFRGGGRGLIVRVKTHGERAGRPRAFRPHLSVVYQEGVADYHGGDAKAQGIDDYQNHEKGKFSTAGRLEGKSPPGGTEADKQNWADRTHFMIPGFEDSTPGNPRGLGGADDLKLDAASA